MLSGGWPSEEGRWSLWQTEEKSRLVSKGGTLHQLARLPPAKISVLVLGLSVHPQEYFCLTRWQRGEWDILRGCLFVFFP